MTRRKALSIGLAGLLLPLVQRRRDRPRAGGLGDLVIRPRSDWGADLSPVGALQPEPDVRFLLVHHTAGRSEYRESAVPDQIREVFSFHTSPAKGWSDVCYNFFIDRYGGVWEGRQGSASGPVMADATGGSQGFAQLVCLLGNFHVSAPTPEMLESLEILLAHLAQRYALDTAQDATTTFVSRGSNKWPVGASVTARIISGHRDMSATVCPGDFVYPLIETSISQQVRLLTAAPSQASDASTTTASTMTAPTTASATTTDSTLVLSTSPPTTAPAAIANDTTSPTVEDASTSSNEPNSAGDGNNSVIPIATGVAIGGAAIAVGAFVAARRPRSD